MRTERIPGAGISSAAKERARKVAASLVALILGAVAGAVPWPLVEAIGEPIGWIVFGAVEIAVVLAVAILTVWARISILSSGVGFAVGLLLAPILGLFLYLELGGDFSPGN